MGAMENKGLNIFNDAPDPGLARDRHRRELRGHRARDRARVLPQLDRQPHHLPRLVPALPQGGPHRLPRPGVLRRPALGHGRAHPRRAQPEGARSSPRTRARWPIPCAPTATSRSTTSIRRPSTTRAPRSCACSRRCWGARASARAWTSISSATTGRRRRWRTSSPASRTPPDRDLQQFMTWYSQAGTPELVCQLKYDARAKTAELTVAQVLPPTPGEPKKKPLHIPLRLGPARRQRPGPAAHAGLRRAPRGRRHRGQQAHRDLPLPRCALAAGAVAAARLLGAGQPDDRAVGRGPAVPDGQRQRPLQSLAGGAGLRDARAGGGGEGPARRQAAGQAQGVRGSARRHPRRSRASSPAIARSSCSCRARATSPASSAGTWTRSPSTRRARSCARRSAPTLYDALADTYRKHEAEGPLLAGTGGGRQAGPAQRGAGLPGLPRQGRGRRPRWRPISPTPATPPTR